MRRSPYLLSTLTLLLAGGQALSAQSLQTGALIGVVRDSDGKPLAGAHIRLRSGQIERTLLTSEHGEYRASLLNPGGWALTVVMKGFQTSNTTVRVGINETQTANFKLRPEAEATVVVVDLYSDIDVTTTQTATNFKAETIAKLPTDLSSLNGLDGVLAATPGIQATGSGYAYAHGATADQNLFTVDGTITNQSRYNLGGTSTPPMEFLENVEVVTGAFGAEYNVLGAAVNALTKSGSNTWASSLFYGTNFPNSMAQPKWQTNITPPQTKPLPIDKYQRYGGTLSGPIVKDKLFFFLGYQGFKDRLPSPTLAGPNWNGLASSSTSVDGPNLYSFKVNWYPAADHQLVFSASHSKTETDTGHKYPASRWFYAGTLDTGYQQTSTTQNLNLTWNWVASSELFIVTSLGRYSTPSHTTPYVAASSYYEDDDMRYWSTGPGRNAPNKPAFTEYWTYQTGPSGVFPVSHDNPNQQVRLDLTWNRGSHQVKAGYLQQETRTADYFASYTANYLYNDLTGADYSRFGDASALESFWNAPQDQVIKGHLRSYYLSDLWELLPGLRVNVGLRYDPFRFEGGSSVFNGVELTKFANFGRQVQPRLGVVWDLNNDGKTKFFAHWGRTFQTLPLNSVSWATASARSTSQWTAAHFDYNPDYQAGQRPFTIKTDPATGQPYAPDIFQTFGTVGKPAPHATDIRLPHTDTLTFGGDWTLPRGWSAGGSWQYWTLKDALDDSYFLNDNGSLAFAGMRQKVVWNPRPGPVTFVDSTGLARTWNSPFPDPVDRFISLNLHTRHQGENHYVAVDYTWNHHYGNYRGAGVSNPSLSTGGNVASGLSNATTEFDFHKTLTSGNYEGNPVHSLKVLGSYELPLWGQKLVLGPVLTWQSGLGLTSIVPVKSLYPTYAGRSDDSATLNNQRSDVGHTPSTLNLDLKVSMMIKVGKLVIAPTASIQNVFNASSQTGYILRRYLSVSGNNTNPNPDFGKPLLWQQGRSVTAGFSMTF